MNGLLDGDALDRKAISLVIANLRQEVKTGDLRVHPQIAALVELEMLENMGAAQSKGVTK